MAGTEYGHKLGTLGWYREYIKRIESGYRGLDQESSFLRLKIDESELARTDFPGGVKGVRALDRVAQFCASRWGGGLTIENLDNLVSFVRVETRQTESGAEGLMLPEVADLVDNSENNSGSNFSSAKQTVGRQSSLFVDLTTLRATLFVTGKAPKIFNLPSEQCARWTKVLSDHPGVWIPGPSLEDYDSELEGARTDRLRKQLPRGMRKFVETSKRLGARVK
jgi:hypothetical protein